MHEDPGELSVSPEAAVVWVIMSAPVSVSLSAVMSAVDTVTLHIVTRAGNEPSRSLYYKLLAMSEVCDICIFNAMHTLWCFPSSEGRPVLSRSLLRDSTTSNFAKVHCSLKL